MIPPAFRRIELFELNVRDLTRATEFYVGALGFRVEASTADRACLAIGSQRIALVPRRGTAPYPYPRASNDPWFQHFAIAVADMDAAYEQLSRFSPEPITRGGPQSLPPNTGSVTAYKFRDPDGHPLELSYAPHGDWATAGTRDAVFLGIDHAALAVRDVEASIAFYTGLGFRLGTRSRNEGPEQARLDDLDCPVLDIVTLLTPEAGPHIELLHYRSPAAAPARQVAPDDIAAMTLVMTAVPPVRQIGIDQRDPDGHPLRFTV